MKRWAALLTIAILAAALGGLAEAGPRRERKTQTREYLIPRAFGVSTTVPGVITGDVDFNPNGATRVKVEIEDQVAPATLFSLAQDGKSLGIFCTRTPKAVTVNPSGTLHVELYVASCDGLVGFPTTGLVRATFWSRWKGAS